MDGYFLQNNESLLNWTLIQKYDYILHFALKYIVFSDGPTAYGIETVYLAL